MWLGRRLIEIYLDFCLESTTVCYICYRLPAGEHQQRLGARAGQLRATLVRVTSAVDLGGICTVWVCQHCDWV